MDEHCNDADYAEPFLTRAAVAQSIAGGGDGRSGRGFARKGKAGRRGNTASAAAAR